MYLIRSILFIAITLALLIYVASGLLDWSWVQILGLLALGAIFVSVSIWGYGKMYREDDKF